MNKRSVVLLAGAMVIVAFGAYRLGVRHSAPATSPSAARGGGGKAGCIDFHDAGAHTGETSCITGRVLRVFTSRTGNTFLDFCSDYRQCPFTAAVFASDRAKFGDLGGLGGQRVEIEGRIGVYQGRAEIVIRAPEQLRAVPED